MLDTGKMTRAALSSAVKTTKTYFAKDGRKRFAGSENLKGTQFLGLNRYTMYEFDSFWYLEKHWSI